jgi:transposase
MKQFSRIGIDLGKNVFYIHALESEAGPAVTRKLSRTGMRKHLASIAPCLIGMEACGSAHYWARELRAMGHDVRLMPPSYVKAYVKRGKNDAVDAAAACEAVSRPNMRFVAIKSEQQQAMLMVHKTRDLLVKQRTMLVNSLRGSLAEFGVVVAKGVHRVEELAQKATEANLPETAITVAKVLLEQLARLDAVIAQLTRQIVKAKSDNTVARLLTEIPGIGALFASRVTASVPDATVFKSGRDFAAWLGLTPRQDSTGGKIKLGPITKKGDRALRRLLVIGAVSLLRMAHKRKGTLAQWLSALRARKRGKVAAVALANKLARIVWAMMTTGEAFRTEIFARA